MALNINLSLIPIFQTGTATVTVNIQDVNNHSPKFDLPHYYKDVNENDNDAPVVHVQVTSDN